VRQRQKMGPDRTPQLSERAQALSGLHVQRRAPRLRTLREVHALQRRAWSLVAPRPRQAGRPASPCARPCRRALPCSAASSARAAWRFCMAWVSPSVGRRTRRPPRGSAQLADIWLLARTLAGTSRRRPCPGHHQALARLQRDRRQARRHVQRRATRYGRALNRTPEQPRHQPAPSSSRHGRSAFTRASC
jgi:hypothetical protein